MTLNILNFFSEEVKLGLKVKERRVSLFNCYKVNLFCECKQDTRGERSCC